MATQAVFYPHAIVMPTGNDITQLQNVRPSENHRDLIEFATGDVGPGFAGSHSQAPDMVFESSQIKDILDLLNVDAVARDLSSGNVDIEYRKGLNRASRTAVATTAHLRGRMQSNAFLSWQRLEASQDSIAQLTARMVPVYDGTNTPLAWTASVAATATSAIQHLFTLGPVKVNGSQVGGVKRMTIDNQIEYEEEMADGLPYLDYAAVRRMSPQLTFTARNSELIATYGHGGADLSSLTVYLRKKSAAGFNVADGTAEHIKLTAADGTIRAREIGGDEANVEIQVDIVKATGAWWTIDTASAIT